MPSNPWDEYKSDDPKVLAEQERTKKLKAGRLNPPPALDAAKVPKATDAWGQAGKFAKRNRKIEAATRPIRKALPGQGG